jgi:hypothetical protein
VLDEGLHGVQRRGAQLLLLGLEGLQRRLDGVDLRPQRLGPGRLLLLAGEQKLFVVACIMCVLRISLIISIMRRRMLNKLLLLFASKKRVFTWTAD